MSTKRRSTREKPANPQAPKTSLVPLGGSRPFKTLEELAAEQGVKPIEDMAAFRRLAAGIWPEDESIDDFLAWLYQSRREGR